MIRLLSERIASPEGYYHTERIIQEEFVTLLKSGEYISYVRYLRTADFIQEISGLAIEVNRCPVAHNEGDDIIICECIYRPDDSILDDRFIIVAPIYRFYKCRFSQSPILD